MWCVVSTACDSIVLVCKCTYSGATEQSVERNDVMCSFLDLALFCY